MASPKRPMDCPKTTRLRWVWFLGPFLGTLLVLTAIAEEYTRRYSWYARHNTEVPIGLIAVEAVLVLCVSLALVLSGAVEGLIRILPWFTPGTMQFSKRTWLVAGSFCTGAAIIVVCMVTIFHSSTGRYCAICGMPAETSAEYRVVSESGLNFGRRDIAFCVRHVRSAPDLIGTAKDRWGNVTQDHDLPTWPGPSWTKFILEAGILAFLSLVVISSGNKRIDRPTFGQIVYAFLLAVIWPTFWFNNYLAIPFIIIAFLGLSALSG